MEKYGIGDYAVANYPNIVRMDCGLLHRQFNRISKLSNARRLFEHPFIIRLVLRMSTFDDYALANGQCFDDIFDETFAEYVEIRESFVIGGKQALRMRVKSGPFCVARIL